MSASDYADKLSREAKHWGDRLAVERVQRNAWLDHPLINRHYHERGLIDGLSWERWVVRQLGRTAARSFELGCGSAGRSLRLYDLQITRAIQGLDVSPDRVNEGEHERRRRQAEGGFLVADVNTVSLPADTYDLIFSCHSFHHFEALEHVMDQVNRALTPDGYFVLEEFVGPTQFQWTDAQIGLVRQLSGLLPERMRMLRWGAVKTHEGRPTVADVVAVSPFESIRSGEIVDLFYEHFNVEEVRLQGGTLQHLLYNGIIHNFVDNDEEADDYLRAIWQVEDALVDAGLIPSDFQLLVGRKKT